MTAQQRIVRVRRSYNQWVANQTLEDYALRFTAKSARRWSSFRVANTAIGAISFLALEAIGGAITINYGFTNAAAAILVVGTLIFITSLPITYYAATAGVDIDLLTRGAGFGYIGSTITSLIYASFTFIFFAIEAAIMSLALEMCFGIPLFIGYVISSIVVIPLVTHGITLISRFQMWTQPIWIVLHLLPFGFIAASDSPLFKDWTHFTGIEGGTASFDLLLFGLASTVMFSLIAQIGEQVDFLRFLPPQGPKKSVRWWLALLSAGPGWIIPGIVKLLAGSFLAVLAVRHFVPLEKAAEPTQMYLVAFQYVFTSPSWALAFTGAFVIISQIKINVTNAYAGSIAWSNFFSRLTHSHPGRVIWLVFNVTIALLLMELGIFKALERILGFYSIVAVAWVGALVADLIINKPLGLSPPVIEFKRAHLYDVNPVGVGAMVLAALAGIIALTGVLGPQAQALPAFITLAVAFIAAPAIAYGTGSRYYIARPPQRDWAGQTIIRCVICEHQFESEDMAQCPAYSGPICSLCCSLETRCHDLCKPQGRISNQFLSVLRRWLPEWAVNPINTDLGRYLGVLLLFSGLIGAVLSLVYFQITLDSGGLNTDGLKSTLWTVFFVLSIIAGIGAWLLVLAQESRRVAEEETSRQTDLLMKEIEAHKLTDGKLQKAKEVAEAANEAKSRHVVGLSHELRTPLNAILGYAQILERDPTMPPRRTEALKVVRRSAEHLSGLIDGLLDISKIEAGRFHLDNNEVRIQDFLDQLVGMFRLQAAARGIDFNFVPPKRLPTVVHTDENRLRQILINLLSNAIKFTEAGHVTLRMSYRNQVAEFVIEDSGIGIHPDDRQRIFQPFERSRISIERQIIGTGLGLTITRLLTEIMGGEIKVESEVGKGSTFRVKLMLAEVFKPRTTSKMEDRVRGYKGARQTILVVDDNESQRTLVREMLEPLRFNILLAGSGRECLELTELHKPNLILLDVGMPEMDGWEVGQQLRQIPRDRPAIVMLSAFAPDPKHKADPNRVHDDYLIKPFDVRQLLGKIHALLDIEWIYAPKPDAPPLAPAAFPPAVLPAARDIDELIRLAQIGHVTAVADKLAEMENSSPEHRGLTTYLKVFVDGFDLKRFIAALESIRGGHG